MEQASNDVPNAYVCSGRVAGYSDATVAALSACADAALSRCTALSGSGADVGLETGAMEAPSFPLCGRREHTFDREGGG